MRSILAIELLFLVGPALMIWIIGLTLSPFQIYVLLLTDEPAEGPLLVLGSVAAGTCGLISILDLYRKATNPRVATLSTRWLSVLGMLGALPLIYSASNSSFPASSPAGFVLLMPLVAGFHLVYLARNTLFGTNNGN